MEKQQPTIVLQTVSQVLLARLVMGDAATVRDLEAAGFLLKAPLEAPPEETPLPTEQLLREQPGLAAIL